MAQRTCSIDDCDKPTVGRGYCRKHYGRWHRHGDPLYVTPPPAPSERVCDIDGCGQPHLARGYCTLHYGRFKNHDDPLYEVERRPETCTIEGCGKVHFSRDLCSAHYAKLRKYGDPLERRYGLPSEPCIIDGCDKDGTAGHGWCYLHYRRYWRHGDPRESSRVVGFTDTRVWGNFEDDDDTDCWIWTGALNEGGYGIVRVGDSMVPVHRYTYHHLVGDIPEDLELDHLCRNRACANPDHLEPVTHRENVIRGTSPMAAHAHKSHCMRGHEFSPVNTYVTTRGHRTCRACRRAWERNRAA